MRVTKKEALKAYKNPEVKILLNIYFPTFDDYWKEIDRLNNLSDSEYQSVYSKSQKKLKIIHKIVSGKNKERSYLINNRYEIYSDGVIYDTKKAKDIPQWIFELRDFVLENYKKMKHYID